MDGGFPSTEILVNEEEIGRAMDHGAIDTRVSFEESGKENLPGGHLAGSGGRRQGRIPCPLP
jgi:hypothetical protein